MPRPSISSPRGKNYEYSHRRADEHADTQACRNEARADVPHLQSIDERRDDDGKDRQQPDRRHEPCGDVPTLVS